MADHDIEISAPAPPPVDGGPTIVATGGVETPGGTQRRATSNQAATTLSRPRAAQSPDNG